MRSIRRRFFILFASMASIYAVSNPWIGSALVRAIGTSYEAVMKQDLLCLMLAYPEYIDDVEKSDDGIYLVMKSGKKLLYDDKKQKDYEEKLNNPDLQDMMEQYYPMTRINRLMDENKDPGRVRVYPLLDEVYGGSRQEIEGNIIGVNTDCGSFQFNKNNKAAEALETVMKELVPLASARQDIKSALYPCAGTYSYRMISGTRRLSPHAYGIAIDLAVDKRDYWQWTARAEGQKRLASYPAEIVQAFERNGFIWGGKWGHFDIMHFEYRPEIILKARYFGNTGDLRFAWNKGAPVWDEYTKSCIDKIERALN